MAIYRGLGDQFAQFCEKYIVQTKGRWAGKPLTLEPWQRAFLDELFLVDGDGQRVYREALLGVPRKTGKSTLCAALGLHMLLASGENAPEIYSAAASRDQARVVFDQARDFVEASPMLHDWLRPMRSAITCPSNGGVYRVLSAEGSLAHGLNGSGIIIDELHAFTTPAQEELYYALTTGSLARENPMIVSITTAGYDRETVCYKVYEHGRKLAEKGPGAMRDARFLFEWRSAPEGAGIEDEEAWAKANPSSWIKMDDLRRERGRLPEHVFRRLHLNQWTTAERAWLPFGVWDACKVDGLEIEEGAQVILGVDLGLKHDSAAITVLHPRDDGRFAVQTHVLEPPGAGDSLDISAVEQKIRDLALLYDLRSVPYDPWRFERSAQILADEGIPMVEHPMTNERMAPASERLYEAIVAGRIIHNGDPVLTHHVLAGTITDTERGWRLTKRKAKDRVDALIALTIALALADVPKLEPLVAFA